MYVKGAGRACYTPKSPAAPGYNSKILIEWMLGLHLPSISLRRMMDGFAHTSRKHGTLVYGAELGDRAQPRASMSGAPSLS